MRFSRSVMLSLVTFIVLGISAIAGPKLLQTEIDQRISGLEARVTVLEQQVAELQDDGVVATPIPVTYTIEGTIRLRQDFDEPVIRVGSMTYCSGTRGYDDIQTGANVVVFDGAGTTLATTELKTIDVDMTMTNVCEFAFTVEVPESDFYTVKIGRRGAPTYSFSEMVDNDWKMELSIGS